MSNSSKGVAKFASVLQQRMSQVNKRNTSVTVEFGEILKGRKLKVSSLPGTVLDKDDYSVCASLQAKMPCQGSYPIEPGDKVLVVWTLDGEPVVIDRILSADASGAVTSCKWQNTCPGLSSVKSNLNALEKRVEGLEKNG